MKIAKANRGKKATGRRAEGLAIGRTWAKGKTKEDTPSIARRSEICAGILRGRRNEAHSVRMRELYALHPERHPNAIIAKKTKGKGYTNIEKIVAEILTEGGVEFQFNARIGTKWVDFLISGTNLVVEADGERWHTNKEGETLRDLYIESMGFRILHLPGRKIMKDRDTCRTEILAFVWSTRE
ncbi:DUF559 domain-containing protein [Azospirillum argentinense]|uniref:DUF559 domain-containing protein n=1 Tax=Azospirillum argentinense TaxID=2970906 RepID=UPI0015861DCC|nr:DUF559 domain-containing protein [Azospirillum argentinense]